MSKNASSVQGKAFKIEERSTKPPGKARFFRSKEIASGDGLNLFQNDTFNTAAMCQQLLVGGFVQSYVDFYQLTHRLDPNAVEDTSMEQIQISEEDTIFIRDNLVKAEISRRQGDTASVYAAFNQLADYYVRNNDWKTSFFFHEKCLEVSQLTSDVRAEMAANHALGTIYQLMNKFDKACAYHERHEELATSVDIFEEISVANVQLNKVYLVLAEKAENHGHKEEALELYKKCLQSAKKSWDRSAEGEANGRIGNLLLSRGEAQESLPYLKQQSQIAADLGHAEGRCKSCSSLALALDSMGQTEKALNELKMVVTISEQTGDAYLQAQACKALGTLFSKVGKLEEAVEILQRHFNLLKKILYRTQGGGEVKGSLPPSDEEHPVSSQDVDLARVLIGVSKGNLLLGKYAIALQYDLTSLLDWKLNRTELPSTDTRDSDTRSRLKSFGIATASVPSASSIPRLADTTETSTATAEAEEASPVPPHAVET